MESEQLLSVASRAEQTLGERPSPATCWRWITKGILMPDGKRIKLHAHKLLGHWRCSATAWNQFVSNLAVQPDLAAPALVGQRSIETSKELSAAGLV